MLFIQPNLHCCRFDRQHYIQTNVKHETKKGAYVERSYIFLELLINAEDTYQVCVQAVSSAAGSVSSSRGRSPDTDSQLWTSAEGKLLFLPLSPAHPPPPSPPDTTDHSLYLFCLVSTASHPSGNLYYFIFLRSLWPSIIPASFFAPLVFGSDPTTALQCRGRCINILFFFFSSFQPARCLTQRLFPLMVKALLNFFLFFFFTWHTLKYTCGLHNIWAAQAKEKNS